jgi:hypothetical protein
MPMNMGMAAVLYNVAEACQVLGFLVVLPGACASAYRWARKHPYWPGYRPRHAREGCSSSTRQIRPMHTERANGTGLDDGYTELARLYQR